MKRILSSIRRHRKDTAAAVLVAVLYVVNNLYLKSQFSGNLRIFFVCYLNDLMAPVFLLSYANILLGSIQRRLQKLWQILPMIFVFGCCWEFAAPLFKQSSVTDLIDILCYMAGAVLYWALIGRGQND